MSVSILNASLLFWARESRKVLGYAGMLESLPPRHAAQPRSLPGEESVKACHNTPWCLPGLGLLMCLTWVTDCQMWDLCMMSATQRPVVSPCHLQMLTACSWHSSKGNLRVTCQKKKSTLILQVTEPVRWQSSHSLPLGHPPSVPPLEASLQWFASFTKKGPSVFSPQTHLSSPHLFLNSPRC